jgi:hypothetical protein
VKCCTSASVPTLVGADDVDAELPALAAPDAARRGGILQRVRCKDCSMETCHLAHTKQECLRLVADASNGVISCQQCLRRL